MTMSVSASWLDGVNARWQRMWASGDDAPGDAVEGLRGLSEETRWLRTIGID
jgi:hypothetical protein